MRPEQWGSERLFSARVGRLLNLQVLVIPHLQLGDPLDRPSARIDTLHILRLVQGPFGEALELLAKVKEEWVGRRYEEWLLAEATDGEK